MIEPIVRLSLRHRWIVVVVAATLVAVGSWRTSTMPVDVFPDLTAPRVTVVTESTGMASEEVERLITFPVEAAVNGAAGLRRVRSASAPGISVVWAEFDWETDAALARQRINERLQSLSGLLPPGASAPLLAPAASVMGEIAFVALTSDVLSGVELRRISDVEVRRSLLSVEGISQVVAIGGEEKQYHILVDALRLESYGLTLQRVVDAIRRGSQNAPGGYAVDGGQESVIRVLGRAHGVTDLKAMVVVMRQGIPVRVGDVAQVVEGSAVARGAASYNATPAVILSIVKQPSADTLSTTRRLDQRLASLVPFLEARQVQLHGDVFKQQDFIDRAIINVVSVLRDGALMVVLVLFIFLWRVRPTLISVIAIPLSLVAATTVLQAFGYRLDTMTLGGLAIAMGELVDDAIVDVENVLRRLRDRLEQPVHERLTVFETVLQASLEIREAIVSATLILLLVFLPLLFLDGMEGRLLQPLAIAYLTAIFASLVVALTVTPVLCYFLLPRTLQSADAPLSPVLNWVQGKYRHVLAYVMPRPTVVLTVSALILFLGLIGFHDVGRSFLPTFNEGSLTVNMVLMPGTALEESGALATMAERQLLSDPGVLSVGRRTGRAERDEHAQGVENTEMEVRIRPEDQRSREQLFSDIRERLKAVPATFVLGQPISHRIEHMMSGQRADFAVKVFGDNLSELRQFVSRIEEVMQEVDGIVDLNTEQVIDVPQWTIQVDAQAASTYGFSAGEAASTIGTALWGTVPTQIYEDGTTTDVVVRYPIRGTTDQAVLERILIPTPTGAVVPISVIAEVRRDSGPNYILREGVSRRLVISANVESADIRGVYERTKSHIESRLKIPDGLRLVYAGQFEREESTNRRLWGLGLLVMVGIALVVVTTLKSVPRTMIVLVNLPLALAGGVMGVHWAGGVLSVATTIGFITLFGIATRNGLLVATRSRDLEMQGVARIEAVTTASKERLAPILMTALTAALALLPLALAAGQPGTEIQAPMAMVILTGLTTSTLLNMLVVPPLLARWS